MFLSEHRFHDILALLKEDGRVGVSDLAPRLHVSEETVRRDLKTLEG
ncbi:DeoR family transcriptional regulator, partial [Thioclava sp. BHET1]